MLSFKNYNKIISEQTQEFGHLKHLEHAEDHTLLDGERGFHHATDVLRHTHDTLKGKKTGTRITVKYDGAPAVVFGKHPKTGKFFVGTKSVFNKEPKINYTDSDIDKNHGHAPGLATKLKQTLKHLHKVAPRRGVYQGDLMYTHDDVRHDNDHYHFTPNTITYSVHKNHKEGKKVAKAKMGIVVHTQYHGSDVSSMKAKFDPDVRNFKKHDDVHIINHELDLKKINHPENNKKKFQRYTNLAKSKHSEAGSDMHHSLEQHRPHISTYINQTVRTGERPTHSGFVKHLTKIHNKEVEKVKTEKVRSQKKTINTTAMNHVQTNKKHFDSFFRVHKNVQNAKNALVSSLDHTVSKHLPYKHSIAGKKTNPEGYVVTHNGQPTKLVNRAEFAKHNFMKGKPSS